MEGDTGGETGHGRLEKYLPTNYGASGRAWKMGGGEEATAVEKGGRMSATQAENKQTTVQALGLSMVAGDMLSCSGLADPEGRSSASPRRKRRLQVAQPLTHIAPKPCPFLSLGPQFPHLIKEGFQATCLCLCCAPYQVFPLPALSRKQKTVLVVCGPEQNGAVGLVCARHLRVFVSSKDLLGVPGSLPILSLQKSLPPLGSVPGEH